MATERYSYKCACKKDPMSGGVNLGRDSDKLPTIYGILDKAWEQSHSGPTCTPADKARSVSRWTKPKKGAE